jgi:uncharacterized membrane protein (GlpM family)
MTNHKIKNLVFAVACWLFVDILHVKPALAAAIKRNVAVKDVVIPVVAL